MIKADCHVHTSFSSDSEASPVSMAERAIELGLSRICFTDHYDHLFPHDVPGGFIFDAEERYEYLLGVKEKYSGKLDIGIGVELGLRYEDGFLEKTKKFFDEFITKHDYDFFIGSTHLLDNYDPYYPEFWSDKTKEQVMGMYFDSIVTNSKEYDSFDSYGHLDYVIRYTPKEKGDKDYCYDDYREVIDVILRQLIEKGKALECNTAGLCYGLPYAHPKPEILRRYKELGGELLTVGSDAHKPENLAFGFSQAAAMIEAAGFKYITVYRHRKPEQIKL